MKLALVLALCAAALMGCMKVPAGTHVLVTDHPQDLCGSYTNCYHAPTRTIVVVPGQSLKVWAHELCHAHQHQTILDQLGREPGLSLDEWYDTDEANDWLVVVGDRAGDGFDAAFASPLESFAEACAMFLTGKPLDDLRYGFFEERGFK